MTLPINAHTLPEWYAYRYSESAMAPGKYHLVHWTYRYADMMSVSPGPNSTTRAMTYRGPLVERPPWLTFILTIARVGDHITHVVPTSYHGCHSWYVYFATDCEHNLLHFGPEP